MPEDTTDEFVLRNGSAQRAAFADIISVQAILCVLTAILFVAVNIVDTDLASDIFTVYLDKNSDTSGFMNAAYALLDFLRSTPNV